jgi:hypothetical protein
VGGQDAAKDVVITGGRQAVRTLKSYPPVFLVGLACVLFTVAVVVGACGSTATGVETYTDPAYGFSFDYPADWRLKVYEVTPETIPDSGGALAWGGKVSDVGFLDRDGATAADTYMDLAEVRAFYMGRPIDESNMSSLKSQLESASVDWGSGVTDVKVIEALTETSMGGMKGFKRTHSFVKDGVPFVTTAYFLFSGPMEYIVQTQAAEENWTANQPVFDAFLASFKPGGVTMAASTTTPAATGTTSATTSEPSELPEPQEGERRMAVMGPVTTHAETGGQFGLTGFKYTATVTFKDGSTAEVDDSVPEGVTNGEDLAMAWILASTRDQSDVAVEFRDGKWMVVAIY